MKKSLLQFLRPKGDVIEKEGEKLDTWHSYFALARLSATPVTIQATSGQTKKTLRTKCTCEEQLSAKVNLMPGSSHNHCGMVLYRTYCDDPTVLAFIHHRLVCD